MNDINLVYVAIDGAAVTVTLLLGIRLISQTADKRLIFLFAWMFLGIACNVVTSRHNYSPLIDWGYQLELGDLYPFFNLFRNSLAGPMMLACHLVFCDDNRLPRTWLALWCIQVLFEEPVAWLLGTGWHDELEVLVYEAIPAVLQTAFLAVTIYWVLANRSVDMVASRRTARSMVLVLITIQSLVILLVERVAFQLNWVPFDWQYPIHMLAVAFGALLTGGLLFAAFSPNVALVLGKRREQSSATVDRGKDAQDHADTVRLRDAFEAEHIYRTPGLSVSGLADHLAIPEYRLRNLVHDGLGFRNFNALLHHYRIQEVCAALVDPAKNATPVLTLALTAGYQSINPFNRAFRELHGVTPTEYRRAQQNQVET